MKILIGLIFCIFMGVTGISLGFGTIYPPLNQVAKPFVCPDGEMSAQRSVTTVHAGKTVTEASWTCEDSSGKKLPINKFMLTLYAGTIHGLLLFVFFWIIIKIRKKSS